jgi:hypothetical protein
VITRSRVRFVRALCEVILLAIWVEMALRRRPFEWVLSHASRGRRDGGHAADVDAAMFHRAISDAYRILPIEPTCLKQALIFCRVRRRRGLPAELRIGVQKEGGLFAAHAWVEDGYGTVLTDPQDGFNPLPLPRPAIPGTPASD